MSLRVCLYANTVSYARAGGQFWVYLNWALGLRDLGCEVTWLESADELAPGEDTAAVTARLRARLAPYLPGAEVVVAGVAGEGVQRAAECDLLLNLSYDCRAAVLARFLRRALVDLDPGLTQEWIACGELDIARHDAYFTIGETVGRAGSRIAHDGIRWQYTPPAVHLPSWPRGESDAAAPYTTVTHWWDDWQIVGGEEVDNSKRRTFLEYAALPRRTGAPLELTSELGPEDVEDRAALEGGGWRLRDASDVGTPEAYRDYIQRSRGEFSCAKPSCLLLQNAWVSDRTLCYLASGKPAIVQHTGESRILPDAEGLFRFRTLEEATASVRAAEAGYEHHCEAARALAEERFDAARVVATVLERVL